MKLFAMLAIVVALYFLYRLAFPKKTELPKSNENIPKKRNDETSIVGQSRVVLGYRSQPPPTPATASKSDNSEEKADTFAEENASEPMDIDVPAEYENESEEPGNEDVDTNEEAEELRQTLGSEAELAAGFSYEEMDLAVEAVSQPESENEAEAAEVLYRLEHTECVEQLAAVSPEKALRIKSLISLHVQSIELTDEENRIEDTSDFNIADFLS